MAKLWTSKLSLKIFFMLVAKPSTAGQAKLLVDKADGDERSAGSSCIFHNLADAGWPNYPAYPASTVERNNDGSIYLWNL